MDDIVIRTEKLFYIFILGLVAFITICCNACAPRYYKNFAYKETLISELVLYEELPEYNKNTVCRGPAILHLKSETLYSIVRCYDSNGDGEMLSLVHWGIDVFEYSLTVLIKDKDGRLFHSVKKHPRILIIDVNFDGIGDNIYIFKLSKADGQVVYEKIDIKSKEIVMDEFAPAEFKLSDFKP